MSVPVLSHVWLIADMLYARDGSGVYITVGSNGSGRITWTKSRRP